jgi:hypothetical protein
MKAITLPSIERRAAAERDDAVMPAFFEHLDAGGDIGSTGFGFTSAKTPYLTPASSSSFSVFCVTGSFAKPRIGDEQRPLDAGGLQRIGQFRDAPRAEADGGGVVPVGDEFGHDALMIDGCVGVIPEAVRSEAESGYPGSIPEISK